MKTPSWLVPVIIVVALVLCCCCILLLGGAGFFLYQYHPNANGPTPTPFEIIRQPVNQIDIETLNLLNQTIVPIDDYYEMACRLKEICDIPPTVAPPAVTFQIGDQQTFWINNQDTTSYAQVTATLHYATPHAYFWVQQGVSVDDQKVRDLVDTFENTIYPTDRQFFGSEWTPGVDGDPHIYMLYTDGLGSMVGGYFGSPDEYNPTVRPYSNAHEMFYIASSQSLGADYTYGILAHEFQHMIQWYQNRNEGTLFGEGFADLAYLINGYYPGDSDRYYLLDPDINLTVWESGAGNNNAHYGANFLFVTYFLDRFGEEIMKALIHDQKNGLASMDTVLAQHNVTDPLTGKIITADDFFLDWTIANYLQDASVADGRYAYHNYPSAPRGQPTEEVATCPTGLGTRTVNQYGVDYIHITCKGDYTLQFEGATSVPLLPADPRSGSYAFWSNKGDESDMTLTHEFDFTNVSGPITLTYWTWYDLEENFDYVYLEASVEGQPWTVLVTPSGTADNPNGSSYGWGYTGKSNGWIQETVDLSQYAGQKVSLHFEYVTDLQVNGDGFILDDISIPAINYSTDFETDDGGWQAEGFARVKNTLPQTFRLALITQGTGGTTVQIIPVSADQSADTQLNISQTEAAVLVVAGTTRFTLSLADYQFEIR